MGVVAARQGLPPAPALLAFDGAAILSALVAWRTGRARQAAAICLGLALGATRYAMTIPVVDAGHVATYRDAGPVMLRAWVAEEPEFRGTTTQLTLQTLAVDTDGLELPVRGLVVANVSPWPAVEYGDVLLVEGVLQTPPEDGGFSYRQYLAERGVLAWLPRAQARAVGVRPGPLVAVRRMAGRLKVRLRDVIDSILPNPEAGLLNGMLLGLNHTLPDDLETAFRRAGLTHIIVISGYNIGLVLTLFLLGRHFVRHQLALAAGVLGIAVYALFVGASPPVARAALMGILFGLGTLLGRRSHSLTALAFATLVMTVADPRILWSVSFQLSTAATLGLLVMERRLAAALTVLVERRGPAWQRAAGLIRDGLFCSVAASAATLPVIWYHFGEVSLVSLLANVLVLFIQPLVLIGGAMATIAGVIALPLGRVVGWLAWPALRYTLGVVEKLGNLPGASMPVPQLSVAEVWAAYGVLALTVLALEGRTASGPISARARPAPAAPQTPPAPRPRSGGQAAPGSPAAGRRWKVGLGALAVLAAAVWGAGIALPDGRAHVTFLDVGQGDAILIRSPGGRTVLVDGGPDPTVLLARLGRALPFWERRIDLVVATHADGDHLAGLLPVLDHYSVGAALEPPAMEPGNLVRQWEEALAARGVPRTTAWRGMRVDVGEDLALEVLHPAGPAGAPPGEDQNPYSLVLRVVAGGQAVLLTADIDTSAERSLVAAGLPLGATALKAAHHGAASATSDALLAAARPAVAVISVGADNTYGHPAPATLERLRNAGTSVWRTDACGAVDLILDPAGLRVHTARTCADAGVASQAVAR